MDKRQQRYNMSNNSFFSYFPTIQIAGVDVRELTKQFKINVEKYSDDKTVFITYQVEDGDRPEDVAQKLYKDPQLFWIVLLSNTTKDYFYDWAMKDEELRLYTGKILTDTIQEVQDSLVTGEDLETEFISLYGQTGDTYQEAQDRFSNSTYSILFDANELKKSIRVLNPKRLGDFLFKMDKFLV
jgi:hypothetical protein